MSTLLITIICCVVTLVVAWLVDKICDLFTCKKQNPKSKHTIKDFYDLAKKI